MNKILMTLCISILILTLLISGCTEESNNNKDKDIKEYFIGEWIDANFSGNEWVFTFNEDGSYDTNRTVPGTWQIQNSTHVDLAILEASVTYQFSFSSDYTILTLSAAGYGDFSWTYNLVKIE